jgi:hypothetical protein
VFLVSSPIFLFARGQKHLISEHEKGRFRQRRLNDLRTLKRKVFGTPPITAEVHEASEEVVATRRYFLTPGLQLL